MNQLTVTRISHYELEKIVNSNFGKNRKYYDFAEVQAAGSRSCEHPGDFLFCGICDTVDEEEEFAEDIKDFESRGWPGCLNNDQILCLLCRKGVIAPGHYLVTVCW